jgi:hypothetical protein
VHDDAGLSATHSINGTVIVMSAIDKHITGTTVVYKSIIVCHANASKDNSYPS